MSKKTKTKRVTKFDPFTMAIFRELHGKGKDVLLDYLKDPDASSFANLRLQKALRAADVLGRAMRANLMGNVQAGGFGGSDLPAYLQAGLGRIGRTTGRLRGDIFLGNLLASEQLRRQAMQTALGYQPLETGEESEIRRTGLGRWLPQAIAAGISAATAARPSESPFETTTRLPPFDPLPPLPFPDIPMPPPRLPDIPREIVTSRIGPPGSFFGPAPVYPSFTPLQVPVYPSFTPLTPAGSLFEPAELLLSNRPIPMLLPPSDDDKKKKRR